MTQHSSDVPHLKRDLHKDLVVDILLPTGGNCCNQAITRFELQSGINEMVRRAKTNISSHDESALFPMST